MPYQHEKQKASETSAGEGPVPNSGYGDANGESQVPMLGISLKDITDLNYKTLAAVQSWSSPARRLKAGHPSSNVLAYGHS
ncbi:hypothetical protein FQN53_002877 [Emmonsiellopsis sp. PD_33]|nr:hypothetical protein FQN53_002877 [Emmonsiellopsis sp. PD_33]KAK2806028.1 hypothetical protein FQN51_007981 [Onygenales sp. PD_10]